MHDHLPTPEALLDALSAPTRLGSRPGLEKIRSLLAALGNPHRELPILHIGGTSGKGSTATIAAQILRQAGYRVGLHVKPHLERVEERFVVDDEPITSARLATLIQSVAPAAREVQPSWYELTVALALSYFRELRVDLAVVEVGLGGTYDATNVVDPVTTVLTNVGLDHTEVLGDTIEKIVADKVGIAKPGRPMISGVSQPSAQAIVRERCAAVGAPLRLLGTDFDVLVREIAPHRSCFDFRWPDHELRNLELRPLGRHQIANAALALAAVAISGRVDLQRDEVAVRRALAEVHIPGRLEVVSADPRLILDGAHNPAKMSAFVHALDDLFPGRPATAVVAFKRGHDIGATLGVLAPRVSRLILTSFEATTDFGRGQAVPVEELAALCGESGITVPLAIQPDPGLAVREALATAGPAELAVVTGSLYLVGAVRDWIRNRWTT